MMDIQKLINDYRRRAMSPDDAGSVRVGSLGLLQILGVLENSLAQQEQAKQKPAYYVCDDSDGLDVNKHNEFSCGRSGFPVYRAAPPAPFVVDSKSFERGLFILNETLDDCEDSERGLLLALTKMGVEVADE